MSSVDNIGILATMNTYGRPVNRYIYRPIETAFVNRIIPFILLLCPLLGLGQNGQPFLTQIKADGISLDSRTFGMVQGWDEVIYMAKRQGVIAYDGNNWDLIEVPGIPHAVASDPSTGRLFVGLSNGFGELLVDQTGNYRFKGMLDSTQQSSDFTKILFGSEDVFFYSEDVIYRLHRDKTKGPTRLADADGMMYNGAFAFKNRFFAQTDEGKLNLLYEDSLIPMPIQPFKADEQLLFNLELNTDELLIGTSANRLYEFNGKRFREVEVNDHAYLREHILSDGISLDQEQLALATLSGGCIVIDAKTKKTEFTLNYRTGLPDNEVMALCTDRNGGLWLAHDFGVTRVDMSLPIGEFSSYAGIDGNLLTSIYHKDRLYVATSNGVYYLTKATDMLELQKVMKQQENMRRITSQAKPEQRKPKPVVKKTAPPVAKVIQENKEDIFEGLSAKEKRQLRRKLRQEKRKQKKTEEAEEAEEADESSPETEQLEPAKREVVVQKPEPVPEPKVQQYETPVVEAPSTAKQTKMELSASYIFKLVDGLDIKTRQLVEYGNELLAATNNGVMRITGTSSKPLVENIYVNHISDSEKANRFYVCTDNGFLRLDNIGGVWKKTTVTDSISANIYSVAENGANDLWVTSDNTAWNLHLNEKDSVTGMDEFWFGSDFSEKVEAATIDGVVHFLLPSGIYHFDKLRQRMLPVSDQELYIAGNGEYILNGKGNNWFHNGVDWKPLGKENSGANTSMLELFDFPKHITKDAKGNLWIIDNNSGLHRIFGDHKRGATEPFNVYIRKVSDDDGTQFTLDGIEIERGINSLYFRISAPFFLKSEGTSFQYRVPGLRDNWSRWSNDATIELPFVPAGDYVMEVRARNILGHISELRSVPFSVSQFLWLRWYMILLYVLALAGLVFTIIKIRERSLRETQRQLEGMVKQRTQELEEQKGKVEDLLLNILPKETADELQTNGKATARHYNMVSVLFTDFKGFTRFAEQTKPEDLVTELDNCFIRFDEIIDRYQLEKIKTIGDAYMCAGGVPKVNKSNPIATLLAALEIRDFMKTLAEEKKAAGEKFWEVRIGIHTGPLTAGVVGKKKFAYDIWGDTVNTASRMESSSEAGKVNISGTTYELVKEYFDCEYRGKVDAKGKGLIDMYFVKGLKKEYATTDNGHIASPDLLKIMEW